MCVDAWSSVVAAGSWYARAGGGGLNGAADLRRPVRPGPAGPLRGPPSGLRLHLLGDPHLELAPFDPPAAEADVVVLAPDRPLVYVRGDHEPYGHVHPALARKRVVAAA